VKASISKVLPLIEPAAAAFYENPAADTSSVAAISIAISLRRIADALEAEAKPEEPAPPSPEKRPVPEFKLREAVVPRSGLPYSGAVGMVHRIDSTITPENGLSGALVGVQFEDGNVYGYLPEHLRHATEAEARAAAATFAGMPLREEE
jgi:hypothetical protein